MVTLVVRKNVLDTHTHTQLSAVVGGGRHSLLSHFLPPFCMQLAKRFDDFGVYFKVWTWGTNSADILIKTDFVLNYLLTLSSRTFADVSKTNTTSFSTTIYFSSTLVAMFV